MTDKDIKDEIIDETIESGETVETLSEENEIDKLKTEVDDWKNSYLRKQAEFQNFTKRKEKEFDDLKAFASEKIIVKVLDIVDNLERAIAASSESKDFDSLVKGVELTLSQMKSTVASEGVEAIETEKASFDPHLHMAVAVEDSADHANDEVIAEFQKGYKMKGKVIRPSMVKVCKK
ncbi:MAG: nucleotide exchange factor GrpE [Cetobacterium sp.]|uniref:nucleotide exchange factor GrpE n=1 Tax=Cetobacterium sp. TaxID=2071632 RepID=UPI0025FFE9CE|nr:nucleotide exchange factor GrpE [uncultured Cetobacterium sp.]